MSFESDFLELMPVSVSVTPPTGRNAQGLATYAGGTTKTYAARISGPQQAQRKADTDQIVQLYTVWVNSGADVITPEYKITLPSDEVWGVDKSPIIFGVNRVSDEGGHHHTKITLGFMYHRQGQT